LKFRKFRKNAKALSPVIATIILIAVTVAVSVVVAAWMGALTIGFMGNAEQASITNIQYNTVTVGTFTGANSVVVWIQNTGSSTVTLSSATIDGNAATITNSTGAAPWTVAKGATSSFVIGFSSASLTFTNTAQYTLKIQTAKGNTITGTYTYTGAPTA